MNAVKSFVKWALRFIVLYIAFVALFMMGSMAAADLLPDLTTSEPGLVPDISGLLIVSLAGEGVIAALILTSRRRGWKLIAGLAPAYYGAVTLLMQIETWYFLSSITVSPQLLLRLFLMGVPIAFLYIPLAVWVLGKGKAAPDPLPKPAARMPAKQWAWKLAAVALVYLGLYWSAGYFIAWQNPALRAFYGQPGPALPFFTHTLDTLRQDPGLFPFQILRALLWTLCALPVIRGSKVNPWWTALLVGVFFSVPQNIGHILANPLIPIASVRMSHMIETASSTFIFGLVVVWLFHRAHSSFGDLFAARRDVP